MTDFIEAIKEEKTRAAPLLPQVEQFVTVETGAARRNSEEAFKFLTLSVKEVQTNINGHRSVRLSQRSPGTIQGEPVKHGRLAGAAAAQHHYPHARLSNHSRKWKRFRRDLFLFLVRSLCDQNFDVTFGCLSLSKPVIPMEEPGELFPKFQGIGFKPDRQPVLLVATSRFFPVAERFGDARSDVILGGEISAEVLFREFLAESFDFFESAPFEPVHWPGRFFVEEEDQTFLSFFSRPTILELRDRFVITGRDESITPGEDTQVDVTTIDVGKTPFQWALILGHIVFHRHVFVAETPEGESQLLADLFEISISGRYVNPGHGIFARSLSALLNGQEASP
jgi:hypothetical protein